MRIARGPLARRRGPDPAGTGRRPAHRGNPTPAPPARRIARRRDGREASAMTLPPNTSQRDLVRLALLLCGERPSAKYRPPTKGI